MTQYQCGVDPSEENSGVTSSDEDVPEEGKETVSQVDDTNADPTSIDTNDQLVEASNVSQLPSVVLAGPNSQQTTRDSTPSKTLTNKTLQQEFELLSLNLGSVKAEGLTSGKRSIKFTATVAANQVSNILAARCSPFQL